MRRRIAALALALLMLVSVFPPGLAAEATGKVVFESGPEDANGVFEVSLTVSDVTFHVFELAVRYEPTVVQAVKADGSPATGFRTFATLKNEWMNTVGLELRPDVGFFDFTVYTTPGIEGKWLNEFGEVTVGADESLQIYTFRFKRLTEGDAGFEIATKEKGQPYSIGSPTGVYVGGENGRSAVDVVFRDASGDRSESSSPGESGARSATALLKEAVILKIGSHAAVVEGNVVALYPGERMVTAYAHDDRTFVPVRFVAERLGATVGWINESQTVTVEKDGHRIEMAIGASTYTLDGEERTLDAPAELTPSTDGYFRTMVPIRFVSEALGYQVEWDQARNLVIIAPKALNWTPTGEAESQAMDRAISGIIQFGNFV